MSVLDDVDHRTSVEVAVMQEFRGAWPGALGRTTRRASSRKAPGRGSKNETVLNVVNRLVGERSGAPADLARNLRLGALRIEAPGLHCSRCGSQP